MVKYLGKYPFEEEDKREWIRTNAEYLTKTYHGMSTKEAQKAINPDAVKFKTAEGKSVTVPVTGTICQWAENFTDYLRSAMSYTGKRTLTAMLTLWSTRTESPKLSISSKKNYFTVKFYPMPVTRC